MANKKLGIDVEIKYPTANQIKSELDKKWQAVKGEHELKINVTPDKNSLRTLKSRVQSYLKGTDFDLKLKIDTSGAISSFSKLKSEFKTLKAEMEKGVHLKVEGFDTKSVSGGMSKGIGESAKQVNKVLGETKKLSADVNESFLESGGSYGKLVRSIKIGSDGMETMQSTVTTTLNSFEKMTTTMDTNGKQSLVATQDRVSALKEIVAAQKEINSLEVKRASVKGTDQDVYTKRIADISSHLKTLKSDYEQVFKEDPNSQWLVKNVESIGEMNISLKELSIEKERQAAYDKETAQTLKSVIQLENERFSIMKQMDSSGENEKSALQEKLSMVERQSSALQNQLEIEGRLTYAQQESLSVIKAENDAQMKILQAKRKDAEVAKAQKAAYADMKTQLKEIQSIQSKITELQAKKDAGVQTAAEEEKLGSLKQQLAVRQQLFDATKQTASAEGNMSKEMSESLDKIKQQYTAKEQIRRVTAESNADIAKTNQLYGQIYDSISRVKSLNDKLATAGSKEAAVINKAIDKEKAKQAEIKETIQAQGRVNNAREEEIGLIQKSQGEQSELNAEIARAKNSDTYDDNSTIGNMFDPRTVYNNAKQAGQVVLDVVGNLDKQIVNIEKVADSTPAALERFSTGIFDAASAVGKSADEYGVSVERWVTTGKTLTESVDLAQKSVMGAFVGNIDESDMVDYMSVPLAAFKKSGLEANDILNAMNEVANNNAIEMDDLGAAYKRAAGTASSSGTTFSQLTGMISAAQEATRLGGEKIGTAFKAVDLNFAKMATQLTKMDTTKFDFFKDIGVDVTDANGELRSTYDIVNDLSKVWNNLSSVDQATASSYAAGKNHAAVLQGLVTNWDAVDKASAEALGQVELVNKESGSAYIEFEKQKNSVEFFLAGLKNAWAEFITVASGGKDGVNEVLKLLTDGLKMATNLASNPAFRFLAEKFLKATIWLTAIVAVNKFYNTITKGAMSSFAATKMQITGLKELIATSKVAASSAKTANVATATNAAMSRTAYQASTKAAKGSIGFMGSIGTMGKFAGKAIGTIVPVLGAVSTALMVADLLGIDVLGGLGKVFKAIKDQTTGVDSSLQKFNESIDKSKKKLDDNKILTGQIDTVEKLIKKYEKLGDEKEKTAKKGNEEKVQNGEAPDLKPNLTPEEFELYKKEFNATAESLGFDLKITWNDYDDMKAKLEELKKLTDEVKKKEAKELVKDMSDSQKLGSNGVVYDDEYEKWERQQKATIAMLEQEGNVIEANKKKKALDNSTQSDDFFKVTIQSDNFKAASKAREKAIKEAKKQRKELAEVFDQLEPKDLGKDSSHDAGAMLLPALNDVEKKAKALKSIQDTISKGGTIDPEYMKYLTELDPALSTIATQTGAWKDEERKRVEELVKGSKESSEATSKEMESKIRSLLEYSGMTKGEIDDAVNSTKEGGAALADLYFRLGETGRLAMGISEEVLAAYGENTRDVFVRLTESLDDIPDEKKTEYNLETEEGLFNADILKQALLLPEEISTEYQLFDNDGELKLDTLIDMMDAIPDEVATEFDLNDDEGNISLEKINKAFDELETKAEKEHFLDVLVNYEEFDKSIKTVDERMSEMANMDTVVRINGDSSGLKDENGLAVNMLDNLNDSEATAKIDAEAQGAFDKFGAVELERSILDETNTVLGIDADKSGWDDGRNRTQIESNILDGLNPTPDIDANDQGFQSKKENTKIETSLLSGITGRPKFDANTNQFDTKRQRVDAEVAKERKTSVVFNAVLNGFEWIKNLLSGGSKSVNINANASKSKSAAINPNIASALSQSVGSSLSLGASQSVAQKATSRSTSANGTVYSDRNKDAKVDSDVWRYWSKELFKGLPLERSMDNLNISISKADKNYAKLIPLYKQQITLIDKQIAYQNEIKRAQQSEMNSILSDLRKQGFRTSGNQVTNLDRAKGLKGEKAENATELLNKWKSLYTSLDTITGDINKLQQEKFNANQDIADAKENQLKEKIEKELEKIEKTLKKTEALLTAVKNDTSLFEEKLGFVSDSDFELKLSITEEGINKSSGNIKNLTNEFNRLSKMYVENADNADTVISQLESLKSEILDNADAILDYKEAMKDIELARFAADFENFTSVMDRNISNLNDNIDNLKDGLLSGTSLSDLASSGMFQVDFTRKSKIAKEYEERLSLEDKLNIALDSYAKKNVDRAKNVANATLSIETKKYSNLLKMANDYSNGKASSATVSSPSVGVGGLTADKSKDKEYTAWLDKLQKINNSYTKAYASMVEKYDKAMAGAKTSSDREAISNAMIIEQLKLQEDIYKSMISVNNEAAKQANDRLKDSSLTTEQRNELLDSIKEYQDANMDAQNAIKESINSRFELEFSQMDKMIEKAEKYSDELSNLLDISEAINGSSESKEALYEAIYQGKLNEYANAKDLIDKMKKEQGSFINGSYEWNLLEGKISDLQSNLGDLTVGILNANKNVLDNQLESIQKASEKLSLGGKSLDDWSKYQDTWIDGVEKELELEKLRIKLSNLEDKTLQGKLELMDRQEKISKAELEYIDKKLSVAELEEKLSNINGERNVQTLGKNADGEWEWQYVADQTEYDKTKEELDDAKLELEKYKNSQRKAYVEEMNSIIDNIKDGKYESELDLQKAIQDVRSSFDGILGDISDMNLYDTESIMKAYKEYLNNNKVIIGENVTGSGGNTIADTAKQFEQSFLKVSSDISKIIGDELKKALSADPIRGGGQSIIIERQELKFPNVTDSAGLAEAFKELPALAKQLSTAKP